MKKILGLCTVILLVILDQGTKYLASVYLKGTKGIPLIRGALELYYLYPENRGIAFGMFQGGVALFALAAGLILLLLVWFYLRIPEKKRFLPLKLVSLLFAAGAAGNLIDRVFRGYVIDFIWFSLINFPVFNVADCYVVIGGILFVILIVFVYREEDDFSFLTRKES